MSTHYINGNAPTDYNDAQREIARLTVENEQLRRDLADARAQIADMTPRTHFDPWRPHHD